MPEFPRRRSRNHINAASSATPRTPPIAMPAIAPIDRPTLLDPDFEMKDVVEACEARDVVGEAVEDVEDTDCEVVTVGGLVDDVLGAKSVSTDARYWTVIGCAHMVMGPVTAEEDVRPPAPVRAGTFVVKLEDNVATQPANIAVLV